MPKKKNHDPEELSEQEKLNRRVDAMMDPKQPDKQPGAVPPLDIFKGAKTAPELPGQPPEKVDKVAKTASASMPASTPVPVPKQTEALEVPKDPVSKEDPLDDETTDEAVTDIAAKEGDTLLALQDAIGDKATRAAGSLAEQDRQKARRRHWFWLIFIVLFVILVLLALPLDSYTCHWPIGIRLRVTTDILPSVCK